jgi:hypothetical protein
MLVNRSAMAATSRCVQDCELGTRSHASRLATRDVGRHDSGVGRPGTSEKRRVPVESSVIWNPIVTKLQGPVEFINPWSVPPMNGIQE